METRSVFPSAGLRAGMYESFYLRACSPAQPLGVWIRYTVHKRPGHEPTGALWCTVFDARLGQPLMGKARSDELSVPEGAWIAIGEEAVLGPGWARGACCEMSWSLRFKSTAPELRHLRPGWLYRSPLPRTKLTSPAPTAVFDGTIGLPGGSSIELAGWPGMVGHNWGSEHAERWIWLHATGFAESPSAWLDLALGRILFAGRLSPWVANGVLCLDGERHRLGGLLGARPRVSASVAGCSLHLHGARGLAVDLRADNPPGLRAGWRYADPDGGEHDVVNCSLAAIELDVRRPGQAERRLSTTHAGAYELGMRERDHGVPIAPFPDG